MDDEYELHGMHTATVYFENLAAVFLRPAKITTFNYVYFLDLVVLLAGVLALGVTVFTGLPRAARLPGVATFGGVCTFAAALLPFAEGRLTGVADLGVATLAAGFPLVPRLAGVDAFGVISLTGALPLDGFFEATGLGVAAALPRVAFLAGVVTLGDTNAAAALPRVAFLAGVVVLEDTGATVALVRIAFFAGVAGFEADGDLAGTAALPLAALSFFGVGVETDATASSAVRLVPRPTAGLATLAANNDKS